MNFIFGPEHWQKEGTASGHYGNGCIQSSWWDVCFSCVSSFLRLEKQACATILGKGTHVSAANCLKEKSVSGVLITTKHLFAGGWSILEWGFTQESMPIVLCYDDMDSFVIDEMVIRQKAAYTVVLVLSQVFMVVFLPIILSSLL